MTYKDDAAVIKAARLFLFCFLVFLVVFWLRPAGNMCDLRTNTIIWVSLRKVKQILITLSAVVGIRLYKYTTRIENICGVKIKPKLSNILICWVTTAGPASLFYRLSLFDQSVLPSFFLLPRCSIFWYFEWLHIDQIKTCRLYLIMFKVNLFLIYFFQISFFSV